MVLTDKQREEFEAVTRPVVEWLNKNCHPHVVVTVDPTHAELNEGVFAYPTYDYVRD